MCLKSFLYNIEVYTVSKLHTDWICLDSNVWKVIIIYVYAGDGPYVQKLFM